jgi:hypothetical protein
LKELKDRKYDEYLHLKALKKYPYLKRVHRPLYFYQSSMKKDGEEEKSISQNYDSL